MCPFLKTAKKAISLHPTKDLIRFTTNSPQLQTCLPVKKKKNNLKANIDNFITFFCMKHLCLSFIEKILFCFLMHHITM